MGAADRGALGAEEACSGAADDDTVDAIPVGAPLAAETVVAAAGGATVGGVLDGERPTA